MLQTALVFLVFAAFIWLIVSGLRGAWQQEQEWKATEATWTAAHPESRPADTAARRWLDVFGIVAGLAAVWALVAIAGLNVTQACVIVAGPVLIFRYLRQRRRERGAASRARFGGYTPSFRERP